MVDSRVQMVQTANRAACAILAGSRRAGPCHLSLHPVHDSGSPVLARYPVEIPHGSLYSEPVPQVYGLAPFDSAKAFLPVCRRTSPLPKSINGVAHDARSN